MKAGFARLPWLYRNVETSVDHHSNLVFAPYSWFARFNALAHKSHPADDFVRNLVGSAVAVFVCRIGTGGKRRCQSIAVGALDRAEGTLYRFGAPMEPCVN